MPVIKKDNRLDLTKKHDTMSRSDYAAQLQRVQKDLEVATAVGDKKRSEKCREIIEMLKSGMGRV